MKDWVLQSGAKLCDVERRPCITKNGRVHGCPHRASRIPPDDEIYVTRPLVDSRILVDRCGSFVFVMSAGEHSLSPGDPARTGAVTKRLTRSDRQSPVDPRSSRQTPRLKDKMGSLRQSKIMFGTSAEGRDVFLKKSGGAAFQYFFSSPPFLPSFPTPEVCRKYVEERRGGNEWRKGGKEEMNRKLEQLIRFARHQSRRDEKGGKEETRLGFGTVEEGRTQSASGARRKRVEERRKGGDEFEYWNAARYPETKPVSSLSLASLLWSTVYLGLLISGCLVIYRASQITANMPDASCLSSALLCKGGGVGKADSVEFSSALPTPHAPSHDLEEMSFSRVAGDLMPPAAVATDKAPSVMWYTTVTPSLMKT
ncbi:hypothetical protein JZ751_027617 [Albula glossodonta]|uniref:Transmembrane protein n=1 Tax=Albula glossodonta TaxID=121402 RepID=A0A8T2NBS1_9TELE|nr:hypothetical protein JZ751_027617 [Albula glossodonta]